MMDEEKQDCEPFFRRLLFAAAVCLAVLLAGQGLFAADGAVFVSAASRFRAGSAASDLDLTYATYRRADGTLQIVDSNGEFVYDMIVVLIGGQPCYADERGIVAADKMFSFGGSKYYAKKDGSVAINEICTTKDGDMVFATKDGTLAKDRSISRNGDRYYLTSD